MNFFPKTDKKQFEKQWEMLIISGKNRTDFV